MEGTMVKQVSQVRTKNSRKSRSGLTNCPGVVKKYLKNGKKFLVVYLLADFKKYQILKNIFNR